MHLNAVPPLFWILYLSQTLCLIKLDLPTICLLIQLLFSRYQLFSKYWGAWKQFVRLRKDMRARVATVRKTVLVKLQERSFHAWMVFVQINCARRDVKQKALELGNRSRLRWSTGMHDSFICKALIGIYTLQSSYTLTKYAYSTVYVSLPWPTCSALWANFLWHCSILLTM